MILTPLQAAGALHAAGMPLNRLTEFVAIAMAESSLNTDAVSPVGALGPWQIMPFNFAPAGVDINNWRDPIQNAVVAVSLSGHGGNCAPWDTCFANIGVTGRYKFLGWPEPGSAAYNNLPGAAANIGTDKTGGMTPPAGSLATPGMIIALARQQAIFDREMAGFGRELLRWRLAFQRATPPGWRP